MSKKREENKRINLTLREIIKTQTFCDASFYDLNPREKRSVLNYIDFNKIKIKVFGRKWYDVLLNKFFCVEYIKSDEAVFGYRDIELSFETFEEFFNYVQGDIYQNSCFYGYHFTDDEINKHSINLSIINMNSFINETIDLYTFKSINQYKNEDANNNLRVVNEIVLWMNKCKLPSTLSKLEKSYNEFVEKFDFYSSKNVFFSLIMRKYKNDIKNSIIEFACKYDWINGLSFGKILFTYGRDAALYVIENFEGMCSYSTQRRRINVFKEALERYDSGTLEFQRLSGFDSSTQLYYVRNIFSSYFYLLNNEEFFATFEDFVDYINGDLSGADLSNAPVDIAELAKYKTDENTLLPLSKKYNRYNVEKSYTGNHFYVYQKWYDSRNNLILDDYHCFSEFFDFVYFLNGDISNADLLMCEGTENLSLLPELKIDGIKVRSEIAKKIGLPIIPLLNDKYKTKEFEMPDKYELDTLNVLMTNHPEYEDYSGKVSYISDIHLPHRINAYKCKTQDDVSFVIRTIAKTICDEASDINLIAGDTSDNFDLFNEFISNLRSYRRHGVFFFTLGNHELWGMGDTTLECIIRNYKSALTRQNAYAFRLVHNNLFYFEEGWEEINTEELLILSPSELRQKTRGAKIIIFGGIGFAGLNETFNADNGIYENILNRNDEITESTLFLALYNKVIDSLKGKNLIVLTHMPMKDWGGESIHAKKDVVYVNGHNHRNYFYDDGNKRIYADNQVGYKGKRVSLKQIQINISFDWFTDYKDGIYEISKEDYIKFYQGVGESITFNRQHERLFMIKREETYMFFMQTMKGKILILNGGSVRSAGNNSIEYFYDNLINYSKSIHLFLSKYDEFQKRVSFEIKQFGADGTIHGSIVDIDFYNHLYLNPLDNSITPYFAYSMVEKYVYNNLPSLLRYRCPELYSKYQTLIKQKDDRYEIILNNNLSVSNDNTYISSTEMYRVSRILKGLQFTTKYNIVRLWNDNIISNPSEESGRLIVSGIINPDLISHRIEKPKKKEAEQKAKKQILNEEEKAEIRDANYKEKIKKETNGNIVCITYRGSKEKADYLCNICGSKWSIRPDHFKDRRLYTCPICKKN